MRMLLRYRNGQMVEGILLAANRDRIRVAVEAQGDTLELNRADGCYYAESGETVEIEALLPIPGTEFPAFCSQVYPLATFAGRTFVGV